MATRRMLSVDNLRLGVIVLVVAMHAAVTYSGLDSWYYKEGHPLDPASLMAFALFQCFLQAFFMGTLFLVAGYFAAASLKAKGTAAFVKGRLVRLGLPTLFYMLAIQPFTVYFLMDFDHTRYPVPFADFYAGYLLKGYVLSGTGPMWFALALLLFCLVYALAAMAIGRTRPPAPGPFPALMPVRLGLGASLLAFALRLEWPIGTNVLNMQLCYFAQYIILFGFGIAAHGRGWLEGIDPGLARRCLLAALLGIPIPALLAQWSGGFASLDPALLGGWNGLSLAFATWESFTGVCMSIGLVGFLRTAWNTQGPFTKSLSDSAFAVYVFHPPILVGLSLLLRPVALPPLAKFLLLTAVALPACFGAARIIRATPGLRALVQS